MPARAHSRHPCSDSTSGRVGSGTRTVDVTVTVLRRMRQSRRIRSRSVRWHQQHRCRSRPGRTRPPEPHERSPRRHPATARTPARLVAPPLRPPARHPGSPTARHEVDERDQENQPGREELERCRTVLAGHAACLLERLHGSMTHHLQTAVEPKQPEKRQRGQHAYSALLCPATSP
jgi:hypothetical protein